MIGTYVLSEGYYDAYYLQAQKIRRMIADDFRPPSSNATRLPARGPHHRLATGQPDRPGEQLPGRHLHPARLAPAGLPGMSVPVGFGNGHLPVACS